MKTYLFLFIAILLTGCATKGITTQIKPPAKKSSASQIVIFRPNDKVTRPYEVISVVSVVSARSNRAIFTKIKLAAAKIGADAVVEYYEGNSKYLRNIVKWGSSLAVRFVANGPTDTSFSRVCVAIPHARLLQDRKSLKRNVASDSIVRLLSQEMLTRKGYYAFLVNDSIPTFVFNDSLKSGKAKLKYGSKQSDLILGLGFLNTSKVSAGIVSSESNTIEGSLYSKSDNKSIWKDTAKSSVMALGLLYTIGSDKGNKIMSIRKALKELSQSLPTASSEKK